MYQNPGTRAKSYDNRPIQHINQEVGSRWFDNNVVFYTVATSPESKNSIRRHSNRISRHKVLIANFGKHQRAEQSIKYKHQHEVQAYSIELENDMTPAGKEKHKEY